MSKVNYSHCMMIMIVKCCCNFQVLRVCDYCHIVNRISNATIFTIVYLAVSKFIFCFILGYVVQKILFMVLLLVLRRLAIAFYFI